MDVLVNKLLSFNFVRVSNKLSKPIIVNCVPGAGKSYLIRELLKEDERFLAYTFGADITETTDCITILRAPETKPSCNFIIIDEYQLGDWQRFEPIAIFGDPLQGSSECLRPHFTTDLTRRFGSSTCSFLQSIGFQIRSERTDICTIAEAANAELEGTVIAYGPEAEWLLKWYGVSYWKVCEIQGKTFDIVTLVTDYSVVTESNRRDLYLCLTRHRDKLQILNGDATFTTS
uniref:TGB1 n=1 Tax=Garlic common latent virus TaxID=47900 RepID=A0A6M2YTE4_9VIRU|nr:TGB1 [Garlic common latent virus]QED43246.1 TGB1 [Garlic common latent virus]